MTQPSAFLFDLNGTMIDDMDFHLRVWHQLLTQDLHAQFTLEEVKLQMYGKNHDLLNRVFGATAFTDEEAENISRLKEDRYQELYRPYLRLLPGLTEFLEKAHRSNVKMAIGSAAIPYNINFVVDSLHLRKYFSAIVSADDVLHSKPNGETYTKAAFLLGVDPSTCIVFEDVPKGVEAARNAGMKSVVVTTTHHQDEFAHYDNVIAFVKDFNDLQLIQLFGMDDSISAVD